MSPVIILSILLIIICFVLYENNREDFSIINRKIEDRTGLPEGENKIPKNIFQSLSSRYVTKKLYDQTEKWKNKNKDYNYYFFTDNECFKFILDNLGESYALSFCSLTTGAFRSDFFRYCVLYIKGGYWVDISMSPEEPFDKINDKDYDFIVVNDLTNKHSNNKYYINYFYSKICKSNNINIYQAFLGFNKLNPLLKKILDTVCDNIKYKKELTGTLALTGPGVFGDIYKNYDKSNFKYKELFFRLNINLFYLHYAIYDSCVSLVKNKILILKNSLVLDNGIYDDKGTKIITNKFRYSGDHIEKATNKEHYRNENNIFYDNIITDNVVYFNNYFYKKYDSTKKSIFFKDKGFSFFQGMELEKGYNYIIVNNFNLDEKNVKEYKILQDKGFLIVVNTIKLKDKLDLYVGDFIPNDNYVLDKSSL